MLATNYKKVLTHNKLIGVSRRTIASTIWRKTAKPSSSEQLTNTIKDEIQVHRPLTEHEIQKIVNLENIHLVTKYQTKMPQRPPLVQNFFIGKVDQELLTYPQVMQVKDFNEMQKKLGTVTSYFFNSAVTPCELRHRDLSNQTVADLRHMQLFGSSVPQNYAGAGNFKSEMNWASESEANDLKSFSVLAAHRMAVEAITDHGNTSQKNQYLMDMAKGETIGTICLHDPLDKTDINRVTVSKSPDDDYILNGLWRELNCINGCQILNQNNRLSVSGRKRFVTYSQHANLLIVLAEKSKALIDDCDERNINDDGDESEYFDSYIAFVVDPKSSGINILEERSTIGCNDVPFATIEFSNVYVRKDQILSETSDDRKISEKLIASSRLQSATLNMIMAKNMLNHLINFAITTDCNGEKLRDLQFVRESMGKLACSHYGLESMIYLTTGIIDLYDNPKVNFECAVTKAYSQDVLRNVTDFALSLNNASATVADHPSFNGYPIDMRDAIQLQHHETSTALKSNVGRMGLQHAIEHFGSNTSDYKDSVLAKFGLANPTIEHIVPKLFLWHYLHPTFKEMAEDLEFSILRLRYASEILLSRYGESVDARETEIQKLGETAMLNYAMFASIGRASRSYCTGFQYAAYETILAEGLFQTATEQVLRTALDLKHKRNEHYEQYKAIVEKMFMKQK